MFEVKSDHGLKEYMNVGRNLIQNLYANLLAIVLPLTLHQSTDMASLYLNIVNGTIQMWEVVFYAMAVVYILDYYLVREKIDALIEVCGYRGHGPTLRYWTDIILLLIWTALLFSVKHKSFLLYAFYFVMFFKSISLKLLLRDMRDDAQIVCQFYVGGLYQISRWVLIYIGVFLFSEVLNSVSIDQDFFSMSFLYSVKTSSTLPSAFLIFVFMALVLSWLLRAISAWDIYDGVFVRVRRRLLREKRIFQIIKFIQSRRWIFVPALILFCGFMNSYSRVIFLGIGLFLTFFSQMVMGQGLYYKFCLLQQVRNKALDPAAIAKLLRVF